MTNPFEFFNQNNQSDDEQNNKVTVVKTEQKQKRTHQEKRLYKQQQGQGKNNNQAPVVSDPLPEKTKQSPIFPHMERNKREWKAKELTTGHTHDRQSGTGRQDRPRKAGGGYGNVGNVKDEQNREKYVKESEEVKAETAEGTAEGQTEQPAVEEKPVEAPKQTLEEYYKGKGVELAYTAQTRVAPNRGELNAEWIKKEKLTLLVHTKEDFKNQDRNGEQRVKFNSGKVGLDIDESDFGKLGFGSRPAPRDNAQRNQDNRKGGKKGKLQFSNEDFPTL